MANSPNAVRGDVRDDVRDDRSRPATGGPDRATRPGARAHQPGTVGSHGSNRAVTARRLSVASAALILTGGYVHYCLYRHGYRFIPKIGVSFLLQAGSSAILAAALVVRGGRMRVGRRSVPVAQLTRLSAIGLSLGTLAALGIAHTSGGLFQFHEIGLRPAPQTLVAIVAEVLATLLLGIAVLDARAAARLETVPAAAASPADRAARRAA
jgi:hypothetical protein